MSLSFVDVLDTFSQRLVCEAVLVGYEDRRLYVPDSCASTLLGHIVEIERHDGVPKFPAEVHEEYASLVDMVGEDLSEYLADDDNIDFRSMYSSRFFMLKGGLGIRIEHLEPVFASLQEAGNEYTMSVFQTREGVVPHKLHVSDRRESEISEELVARILQTRFPRANQEDVQDIELMPTHSRKNGTTFEFHLPRVIRAQ